jgi:hypothetical protein
MGIDVLRSVGDEGDVRVRDRVADSSSGDGSGRGKRRVIGFRENFDRNGGLRTLRYMLKDRNALFA